MKKGGALLYIQYIPNTLVRSQNGDIYGNKTYDTNLNNENT